MRTTTIKRRLKAPRERVYAALIDPDAIQRWKVPTGMTCEVHAFEGSQGGSFRISLTYDTPGQSGKTTARTDTYHGRFLELVPNERIVEIDEFESSDPALQGEMKITITLTDTDDGTELLAVHEDIPRGVSLADNELGWQSALTRLAALVET